MQKVIIFLVLSALLSACAAIPQSGAAGFVNLNELQPLPTPASNDIRPLKVEIPEILNYDQ